MYQTHALTWGGGAVSKLIAIPYTSQSVPGTVALLGAMEGWRPGPD